MKQVTWSILAAMLAVMASDAYAGCGIFRRGGCSDPCAAASCGGYGVSSCTTCAATSYATAAVSSTTNCASCGTTSGACAACGDTASLGAVQMGGCADCAAAQVANYAVPMQAVVPTQRSELMDCGPVESFKVVMEPKYFTETQYVPTTEYQDEVRHRTRTVPRQVAVQVQDYRTTTVMVPKTETKTVEYTVLVPQKQEKTVELVETVPVWNEVSDTYTVRVPSLVDVSEEYTVKVAQLRDEPFTYTVYVPQVQKQTKMQTVTNAVPVVRSRTIQVARPVTRMQTVTKDYGHWEIRVEEVAVSAPMMSYAAPSSACGNVNAYGSLASGGISVGGCGTYSGSCGGCGGSGQCFATIQNGCRVRSTCLSCGGCGVASRCGGCGAANGASVSGGCGACAASAAGMSYGAVELGSTCDMSAGTQTVSKRVWVPNVVTEEVPVTENVMENQEVTYTAFEQETQQIPYECTYMVYAPEQRSGTKKVVDYVDESRTRTRKVVQYNEEQRTRVRKELTYKQETRTETVPYVTYTTETRTKEVSYTINVPETRVEPITTTRYDTVNEEVSEEYTVRVPVSSAKEVQVQVCRMVPKLVPVTIYPCSSAVMNSSGSNCAACSGAPTPAPVMSSGCSACGGAMSAACTACQGM